MSEERSLLRDGRALSWAEVASGLQDDPALRAQLTETLRRCPHEAVFFETCPVSRETAGQTFSFVLVDSPALARVSPDASPFRGQLRAGGPVVTFANLSGDARLVVPSPEAFADGAHIARFLRGAPGPLIDQLWQAVGAAVEQWWAETERPVWVSTSGLGVYWLHIRLDSRPKYYSYLPFRDAF